MEGGFFLIQHVDLGQEDGQRITGLGIIGHERPFGAERGDKGPLLLQHGRHRRLRLRARRGYAHDLGRGEGISLAYYGDTFSEVGDTLTGVWHYPGGGNYEVTSTRTSGPTPQQRSAGLTRHRNWWLPAPPGWAPREEDMDRQQHLDLGPSPGPLSTPTTT
jgi:hypothetical protein